LCRAEKADEAGLSGSSAWGQNIRPICSAASSTLAVATRQKPASLEPASLEPASLEPASLAASGEIGSQALFGMTMSATGSPSKSRPRFRHLFEAYNSFVRWQAAGWSEQ
jgi:hypothetical protein